MNLKTEAICAIQSKIRLVIEYGLVAVVITLGGFTIALWAQKKHTDLTLTQVRADLTLSNHKIGVLGSSLKSVQEVNKKQEDTIQELQRLRVLDSETIGSLQAKLQDTIHLRTSEQKKLDQIRNKDEEVDKYLSSPIPARLRNVLVEQDRAFANSGRNKTGESSPSQATN